MAMSEKMAAYIRRRAEHALIRQQTVLMPWMQRVAIWEAGQNGRVRNEAVRLVAEEMSGLRVSKPMARELRARADYQAYRDQFRGDEMAQVRAKWLHKAQDYVDAHHAALLLAKEAKDYVQMAKIAEPVLDRVAPKQEEQAEVAPVIHITLGAKPVELIEEGECEVVEVKRLTPGEG